MKTRRGSFTAVGDATPENVTARIAPHFIRMADTRAKARALRDALNIGAVTLEEFSGNVEEEVGPGVELDELRGLGSRADDAHATSEHVPQLGQLV